MIAFCTQFIRFSYFLLPSGSHSALEILLTFIILRHPYYTNISFSVVSISITFTFIMFLTNRSLFSPSLISTPDFSSSPDFTEHKQILWTSNTSSEESVSDSDKIQTNLRQTYKVYLGSILTY